MSILELAYAACADAPLNKKIRKKERYWSIHPINKKKKGHFYRISAEIIRPENQISIVYFHF